MLNEKYGLLKKEKELADEQQNTSLTEVKSLQAEVETLTGSVKEYIEQAQKLKEEQEATHEENVKERESAAVKLSEMETRLRNAPRRRKCSIL